MTEETTPQPIPETPELILMRAKYPALKQKLAQPFPYFYQLVPKDGQLYNEKLTELQNKLKEDPQVVDLGSCIMVIMGKIQGFPGELDIKEELAKLFNFWRKDLWDTIMKQKATLKWYGMSKQKSHSIYQLKDIEQVKDLYDVQQIKKQRKLIKQYSNLYKAIQKFVQKFEKLKTQQQVNELYEQYKKADQEESKMTKLLSGDKNKPTKVLKVQAPPYQPEEMKNQVSQTKKQMEAEAKIQRQAPVAEQKPVQEEEKKEMMANNEQIGRQEQPKQNEEKKSKKKTQPKEQSSIKKEPKVVVDKKQQMIKNNMSLDLFVKKKKAETDEPQKQKQVPEEMPKEMEPETKMDKTDIFIEMITKREEEKLPIEDLKKQFITSQKVLIKQVTTCYVNIVMKRSRLEYYDFPVNDIKVDFTNPLGEKQDIRYDDSSDEYSQLVADSINEEMVQEEQEQQEEEQSNSAIVSDSFCQYKSSHVFSEESSDEQDEKNPKPQMIKNMDKWFFSIKQPAEKRQKYIKYDMISLIEDLLPIMVKDQTEQTTNQITPAQKIQMYKQIHGSYTPKDILIKKVNSTVENKISMNKLSTMIKDICQKKGTQRVIKNEMIREIAEEMSEINPNLQAELEQLRSQRQNARNQEMEAKKEEKMNERDQKLEKLILDYEGVMTTNAILEYLRNNEMKIIKQELNSLIKTKEGQKWEHIRNQIKKSKLIKGNKERIKPPKTPKVNKNEQFEEEIKNTHRSIEEIMKQNEIDMANRPKKQKKPKPQNEMVDATQHHEEQIEPQDDDESFELNKKPDKKGKSKRGRKVKKIIVKVNTDLPVRRNPRRNKKESKDENENEMQEEHNSQKQQENEQEENKHSENEVQQKIDEKIQVNSEMQQENKMQDQNKNQNERQVQLKDLEQQGAKSQSIKSELSPIKMQIKDEYMLKPQLQKDQKTANKPETSDKIQLTQQKI